MAKFLVLHGPNLNILGRREVSHYGQKTLIEIDQSLCCIAKRSNHDISCIQSNHEGTLIDAIHDALNNSIDFILFNPAGYTHTSVALRDALLAVNIPFIEIHISNIHNREPFRKHSYFSDIAAGIICGFGPEGYEFALHAAMRKIEGKS